MNKLLNQITERQNEMRLFFIIILKAILFSELVARAVVVDDFWGIGLIITIANSVVIAAVCSLIALLFKGKGKFIFGTIIIVIEMIICTSQVVYNRIFGTFYTIYSMVRGGQVAQFWKDILIGMADRAVPLIILVFLGAATIFSLWHFGYKAKKIPTVKSVKSLVATGLIAVVLSMGAMLFSQAIPNSAYDMLFCTNSIDGSVKNFGVTTAMLLDGERLVFGFEGKVVVKEEQGEEENLEPEAPKYEANRTVNFASLITTETNEDMLQMHRYFNSVTPTRQNEKTGIFAGKNLIMLVGESFSSLAIDPVYTPTLYKLQHEGFYFENFYNPIWGVSTSDGEYVACQGLIPKPGVWSMRESSTNYLPYTMGSQFGRLGYVTKAYHNHYAEYYGRTESHPNMGYEYKGLGTGLKVTEMWPESDLEMMEKSTFEYLTPDENGNIAPFHVYYMTVSGHLNYNFAGQAMCAKNKDLVADLEMSEPCKAYISCNIELDKAMERLLADLEAAGQLDNTVIVLSGDHYPYGLTEENISEFLGHQVDPVFELYKSSLIIYNSATEPETVDKYCSSLDIIPTVSNLFGLEYDSRLMMGRDIFSTAAPLVMFKDQSWITDKGFYNASTRTLQPITTEQVPESYITNINNTVSNKFTFSKLILERDYYRYIADSLYPSTVTEESINIDNSAVDSSTTESAVTVDSPV